MGAPAVPDGGPARVVPAVAAAQLTPPAPRTGRAGLKAPVWKRARPRAQPQTPHRSFSPRANARQKLPTNLI